ncbi:OmpA family protein [Actinomadura barringtoniae]|uniref:OmpA family protein n=1 Tax=Actinomadura barringtoniae TaxID=1427535 RepID=A0A939PR26_9ACTN|nr:OmpA family protein [Actinomadura barringtoniae]MBO2454619.1 OmpA family protein [Actinomadura barringtoniae]
MRRTRTIRTTAVAAVLILLAGCSSPSEAKPEGKTAAPPKYTGPLTKEAWSGLPASHSRIEMKQIERYADHSVLRFYVTDLEREPRTIAFSTGMAGMGKLDLKLIDPLGHKAYFPLYDKDGTGDTVGSQTWPQSNAPGVRYETLLHFPPIPKDVRSLTVIAPTTAGEFTSVPVVDGTGSGGPSAPIVGDNPTPGSTVAWPLRTVVGKAPAWVVDMYGLTEGTVKSTSTSNSEEKIGLRTDVLFDFDKATLTAKAKSVLDDVAAETRAKADPTKPPVIITGHTDGKGAHDYNQRLSEDRAQAVLKELQTRLGTDYRYRAEGKGDTQPIAKEGGPDDDQARAKNRRVEISYQLKQQKTQTTTTTTRAPQEQKTTGGAPAPFHPTDGATIATRTTEGVVFGSHIKRRFDLKPFYRDGAYLVAVFDITNLGPGELVRPVTGYTGNNGGAFGSFGVIDPATGTLYKSVRLGPEDGVTRRYADQDTSVINNAPNTTNRGFFYLPAPPPTVKTVTFDAGIFGKIQNVPLP